MKEEKETKKGQNLTNLNVDIPKKAEKRQVKANYQKKRQENNEKASVLTNKILTQLERKLEQEKKWASSTQEQETRKKEDLEKMIKDMMERVKRLKRRNEWEEKQGKEENLVLLLQEYLRLSTFPEIKNDPLFYEMASTFFAIHTFLQFIEEEKEAQKEDEKELTNEKREIENLKEIVEEITTTQKRQKEEIEEIRKEIENSGEIRLTEKQIEVTNNHLLENIFLMCSLSFLPNNGYGNMTRLLCIGLLASNLEDAKTKTNRIEITKEAYYPNFNPQITDFEKSVKKTKESIKTASFEVKEMEKKMLRTWKDKLNPKLYKLLHEQLEEIENELEKEAKKITALEEEVTDLDKINLEKVKTYSIS